MPTRWLSLRLRDPSQHDSSDLDAAARQPDFDFAFPEPTSPPRNPAGEPMRTARPVNLRPATSGGATGKRKPRTQVSSTRPRTSENHNHPEPKNTNAATKSENSQIGLAFGSPSHPPSSFGTPLADQRSSECNSPCWHRSPLTSRSLQMQSKKWRKIGTLFKSRQVEIKREEVPSGPTIGLPTGLTVLDKSPTSQSSGFAEHKPRPIGKLAQSYRDPPPPPKEGHRHLIQRHTTKSAQQSEDDMLSRPSTATDASIWSQSYTRPPVPKLEIDIPGPPLDRYSVMFRNLPAARRSSSLLARRSKTLESLRSFDDSRPNTKAGEEDESKTDPGTLTPLMPPRFMDTPNSNRSPAASKYSLFPNTSPAPVKIPGRGSDHERHPLKRIASSPARLSPMQDRFFMAKPEPLNPKRLDSNEQMVNSPDDNTASTDREAPWSAAHSFQSSISSATTTDEMIFFDIKSFRDSKGVEDGHFVMTRPDSAAVELVRTRSKKVVATSKLRQAETAQSDQAEVEQPTTSILPPAPTSISNLPSAATTKHTSVNTAYFDEAIAAVERLTSPTTIPQERLPPITFTIPAITVATHSDDKPAQQSTSTSSSAFHSSRPSDIHINRLTSRSREEISRLIPSPVTEVKEDLSPKSDITIIKAPSPSPQPQSPPQAGKIIISPRFAAVRRIDRPIDDSPTIPQGPPSPTRRSPAPIATPKPPAPVPPASSSPGDPDDKPPPVPKKDAKFIPLSKYAAKSTVSKIEQAGIIPTRPIRANTTDNSLPLRSAPISVRTASKERSATLPSSLQGLEKTVPPAPAPARVNPMALNPVTVSVTSNSGSNAAAAEVAVARTVSLSRKQSARVNVARPRLVAPATRRAEAAPSSTTQTAASSSAQGQGHERTGSKAGMGILGHRHRRSASKSQSKDKVKITKREPSETKKIEDVERLFQEAREGAKNWEILEKKAYSPVVVQAERGHKPGLSVGLVVESV
ncbi:hypothetical protein LTR96_003552 [Exophiala xenobiotica]|nr:hypothetical protein LTR96_003552 [Exophiala xenobiotica]KAK5342960.1 hypothetical protein LTR98_000588 [Exophiala xenobiotica]